MYQDELKKREWLARYWYLAVIVSHSLMLLGFIFVIVLIWKTFL
jgi:hypothetical protein